MVSGSPFKINWEDKEAVIAYAKRMQEECAVGLVVFKHPSRSNYNITFTDRSDQYDPEWVVFRP